MPRKTTSTPESKHKQRTAATLEKLLGAAQDVFTRDGYANARLEQIAAEAGYTRGAIYAHFKSKEDLFLALFEQRVQASKAEILKVMEGYATPDERLRAMRAMLVRKASDRNWSMLVLEFKLYALRQPKLKARMQRLIGMLHTASQTEGLSQLFGEMKPSEVFKVERRLALLGAILTAAVLESHFRPDQLSGKNLDAVLAEIIDAVVRK